MNIKEYIESGILETYVSGAASDQERREVECLSSVYPEVKAELVALEEAIQQFSLEFKAPPPPELKNKIIAAIKHTPQVSAMNVISDQTKVESAISDTPTVEMKPSRKDPSNFPWRIAASILLLVSCGLLYFLITLENDYKSEIDGQRENITQLQDKLNDLSQEVTDQQEQLAVVSSPTTLKIPLKSASGEGQENALVFWDSSNQKVYLDPIELPPVAENQQYQLWALKDNQPIDLGTVLKGKIGFQQMKNAMAADAFAITLEPLGGSEQPTLEQLKVIGQI